MSINSSPYQRLDGTLDNAWPCRLSVFYGSMTELYAILTLLILDLSELALFSPLCSDNNQINPITPLANGIKRTRYFI